MIVRSRAPLRISFAGGGTDVPPYCQEKGGAVLSATIDKYVCCTLVPHQGSEMTMTFLGCDEVVSHKHGGGRTPDGEFALVEAVLGYFDVKGGVNVYLQIDASLGSGLGLSSAIVVAAIGALAYWLGRRLADYKLAELAYHIEREQLGIKGGKQDQYAATFGGFNFIEFFRDRTIVNPLRIPYHILDELRCHLLLCYVGSRAPSTNNIANQVNNYAQGKEDVISALASLKVLATLMKNALLQGRLNEFGRLLDHAWESKRKLSDGISNEYIDGLYGAAMQAGAIGGKILGAGGGGHFLLYCPFDRKHIVAKAMRGLGVQIIRFGFEDRGLCTWEADEDATSLYPGGSYSNVGGH